MEGIHMYQLPEYYDWTSDGLDGDVAYYADLAMETGGPVLELGCGTGRCTLGIARHGIEAVGVDLEMQMLKKAEEKAEALDLTHLCKWIQGDMKEFRLERRFPLIIIPYRSFLHLMNTREQLAALGCIRQHLEEGGRFAMNVFVPHVEELVESEDRLLHRGTFTVPGSGDIVEVSDRTRYNHFYQTAEVIRYYERFHPEGRLVERIRTTFSLRYVYPVELNHLLRLAGFEITHRFGGFRREPFGPYSTELVIEAKKRGITGEETI
ncbi:class I SAM-dependent methyltransferase [Desmospora activa]|uniref:Methyltransferase family protein n=1 Tax=Desmospora activa DSM 45169 TaxID=1121389 RepID=A0A2T4Z3E7_9BACL|nr:class I SAM-dependent methyltransferase [Desmospora activa]PTM56409.1 methyltransferase family protein [Desmospora activa DSM 45169]